jgi:DNA-binding FadR family transcriptional regulator
MELTEKIVKRKLSDDVKARLLEMIENGDYSIGDSLPSERELMARFGVGRPAIREAMQYLHNAGLILIRHGHRPTVQHPSVSSIISHVDLAAKYLLTNSSESLEHLKDARLFFETGIVRKAAELAGSDDINRLHRALDEQRQHLRGDAEKFVKADMAFHIGIAMTTGNPVFEATSRAMLGWLEIFHSKSLYWQDNEHITLEEHDEILACINANDAEGAAKAMSDHLNRARNAYKVEKV